MADVKFTDLSAVSGTPDDGSLLCLSTYDGVSTYTSEKLTLTAAKNIFGNAPTSTDNAIARYDSTAGQLQNSGITIDDNDAITLPSSASGTPAKLIFNSSGTNKTFMSDSGSGATIEIDFGAKNEVYFTTDNGGFGTNYLGIYDNGAGLRGYEIGPSSYYQFADVGTFDTYYLSGNTTGRIIESQPKASAPWTGTSALGESSVFCGQSVTVNSTDNAIGLGGTGYTIDTDNTAHVANLNTKIDALGATTGTIDLDTAGNGISDGAYKTVTATGNITLNATTAYSTNNSARWTLEFTQDAGGTNTLTLGTNFLTPGGLGVSVSTGANDTDILVFETDSAGKHRLVEHRKAYA